MNDEINDQSIFFTPDLFLVLWLTTPKPEGNIPILNYERRGRRVLFEFERNEPFKKLHLEYINSSTPSVKFLKDIKANYSMLKDIIHRNAPIPFTDDEEDQ